MLGMVLCIVLYTDARLEVVIAPSGIFLLLAREHLRKELEVAAQNVFDKPNGAFTGEISAEQLKDSGIVWTLVGHSERRVILGEDDSVSIILAEIRYWTLRSRVSLKRLDNLPQLVFGEYAYYGNLVHCQQDKDRFR